MDPQVVVALITVGVGGSLTPILLRLIDRRAEAAKAAVSNSAVEVEAVTNALKGLEILTNQQRSELERERQKNKDLNDDLVEEKAIVLALSREVARMTGRNPDEVVAAAQGPEGDEGTS